MPIILKTKISDRTFLGVWHITETPELLQSLVRLSGEDEVLCNTFGNQLRRKQWLACRALVQDLSEDQGIQIRYGKNGQPFLADGSFNLSLSHSGDYAAAVISADRKTGIDIELLRDRIFRVAGRFMSQEEYDRTTNPSLLEKLTIHWSAKEALYKLYEGEEQDLQNGFTLEPFDYLCSGFGTVSAFAVREKGVRMHTLSYLKTEEWILVYTLDPAG